MPKEVQMTFRVELDLRDNFADAAKQDQLPAAQVLREFMRTYVNQSRERAANDAISPAEKRRRERAVAFARGSVNLEGLTPSSAAELAAQRFIDGMSPLSEFTQMKPIEQNHDR